MPTRREFLKTTLVAGTALALFKGSEGKVWAFAQSPMLRKFVAPLPGLGPNGIPVANTANSPYPGVDFYHLSAQQFEQQMHPDLPNPTRLWGYVDLSTNSPAYLGPAIVATRGKPVVIRMQNDLPPQHILPVDTTIMGAEADVPQNRCCVHLHGGLVPWTSDGGPYAWFSPTGVVGATDGSAGISFLNGVAGSPGAADYYYPNDQSARLAWYHDHSIGITRLNAYAGMAAPYLIVDDVEAALTGGSTPAVPGLAYTIPLVLQDKMFKLTHDQWGRPGDLWYPYVYESNSTGPDSRWDLGTPSDGFENEGAPQTPSCVPEFFADTPVINGMAYPYAEVQPRRYRLLMLNGSQARFYHLQLYYESATNPGEPDFGKPGPAFIQIGTEGGLLPEPVVLNSPPVQIPMDCDGSVKFDGPFNLLLAPAERADLVVDFSSVPVGSNLILYNDAPAPFPMGDSRNDYYTGCPDETSEGGAPSTVAGKGPNTRTLMQIRMVALAGARDPLDFNATLAALQSALPAAYTASHVPFGEPDLDPTAPGVIFENKTLNEDFDEFGRLIQRVGTDAALYADSYGRNYEDPVTEVYPEGQTVVWDIYNTTGDTHPMHFHLVNVQVIGRAPFDNSTPGQVTFTPTGPWQEPDPNYKGWKETVRMNPGEVTRVIMKFDLPKVPFAIPGSPRPGMEGGHEYVWHCHILEHEEHDMMRALVIKPASEG